METKRIGNKISASGFVDLERPAPVTYRTRRSLFRRYRQVALGKVTVIFRRRFKPIVCERSLAISRPVVARRSRVDATIALALSHPVIAPRRQGQ